jgi:hypothetical protein
MKKLFLFVLLIVAINVQAQTFTKHQLDDYARSLRGTPTPKRDVYNTYHPNVIKVQSVSLNDGTTYIRKSDNYGRFEIYDRDWENAKREQQNERIYDSYRNNNNYVEPRKSLRETDPVFMRNIDAIHDILGDVEKMKDELRKNKYNN